MDILILRYRLQGGEWKEYIVKKNRVILGRSPDSDLVLDYQGVSNYHARLSFETDSYYLTDLNSSSGVWIDGGRIPSRMRTLLPLGQPFCILKYEFILVTPGFQQADDVKEVYFNSQYALYYREGEAVWQVYRLPPHDVVLGRAPDCQLELNNNEISRHHARLTLRSGGVWLCDLGSTNGTQVDGSPIPPRKLVPLNPDQTFAIGPFSLKIEVREPNNAQPPMLAPAELEKTRIASPISKESSHSFNLDLAALDHVTIGRAEDNDIILNHPVVSCYHAEIERLGTRFRLRDLRSTNGVRVNNQLVDREVWLKDKDAIRIGPYLLNLTGQNLRTSLEAGLHLEAQNLNQQVSRHINLLQNLNLTIQPMELVAIVGMSGSGKTTLLNALSGYHPASRGQVLIDGVDLYRHYDEFRADMGYVPQKDIVHTELTPVAALEYAARLRMPADTSPEDRHRAVMEVLGELDLVERKDIPISRLSGGQLKRVSIGVELLTKPRLFFLDEPTSGLDPGTEFEMMRLMRSLADQGLTVVLVTHATKNVSFCDKVIFLARGGHLAFYGPPEEALSYFDVFRSSREHHQKEMEFDDIYRILNDEKRGSPEDWSRRYQTSSQHELYCLPAEPSNNKTTGLPVDSINRTSDGQSHRARTSSWRQFVILSSRNLTILFQDRVSLALMLALAPGIGLMDFIWGTKLFDPVHGDPGKIVTMWFMTALITVLVGALSSVREIVKEVDIYKRERAVTLRVFPYILSKVWVGVVLAIYQAGMLLLLRVILVRLHLPDPGDYLALFITLFLGTVCGYLLGLVISASAPNQNAAVLMIIAVLIPQFLFAGALLPLNLIPGGETISIFMPTRWAFEAFINISGMGLKLAQDACWRLPKGQRQLLTEVQKASCPCMGENIFTQCADFPGVLSPDYYSAFTQQLLSQPQPVEPLQPTAYPYPTSLPSPTLLPTPTLLPSPTYLPTPSDPRNFQNYLDQQKAQGQQYQDSILNQFSIYRAESQAQGDAYSQLRTQQGNEYADLRKNQGNEYQQAMRTYGDERTKWQESREKAINSAEALLGTTYDNYGRAFNGTVAKRWLALLAITTGLTLLVIVFQKRKDDV